MNNISAFSPVMSDHLIKGEVQFVQSNHLLISTKSGVYKAKVAASCLLSPEKGDVIAAVNVEGDLYVTTILEKCNSTHAINIAGDLAISSSGKTAVFSQGNITTSSQENVSIIAKNSQIISEEYSVSCQTYTSISNKNKVTSNEIEFNATTLSTKVNRYFQRANEVVRWVKSIESVNISNLMQNVKNTLSSRARNQLITAKDDVKVDGERIHMG